MKKILAVIIMVLIASISFADTIRTTTGEAINGTIISMNELSVTIRTSYGEINISRSNIAAIDTTPAQTQFAPVSNQLTNRPGLMNGVSMDMQTMKFNTFKTFIGVGTGFMIPGALLVSAALSGGIPMFSFGGFSPYVSYYDELEGETVTYPNPMFTVAMSYTLGMGIPGVIMVIVACVMYYNASKIYNQLFNNNVSLILDAGETSTVGLRVKF